MHNIPDLINLDEMIICVTGGNGFIGKKLIEELLKIGCHVRVLTRKKNAKFLGGVEIFIGDLTNPDVSLKGFLKGCDILFHCAGEINNEAQMHLLHINGTQKLINSLHDEFFLSKKMAHWIQLSSCGSYGPPLNNPEIRRVITESSKTNPINEYEKTKTKSDELVIASSVNKFTYTILRPSNVIGSSMKNQSVRNLLKLVNTGCFFFIGKKDAIATYIHLDDVVNALLLIAKNKKSRNEIFNLSNDCSWESLLLEMAALLNVKILPLRIPYTLIKAPLRLLKLIAGNLVHIPRIDIFAFRTTYSTNKIEAHLSFKFTKPMPKSIDDLI